MLCASKFNFTASFKIDRIPYKRDAIVFIRMEGIKI